MTYPLLAAVVTLGAFALAILTASSIVTVLCGPILRRLSGYAPSIRTRALGAIRLSPALAGLVVSAGIVLPLFTWFEPRDTRETIEQLRPCCRLSSL